MKILLLCPKYPDTYWSFRHALKFISKKAASPPLGLLTVAAMLPAEWEKKLVDLNVEVLTDRDLEWADYVFISAMSVQEESIGEILDRCNKLGSKTVAGGPHFTGNPEKYPHVDHLVLNEAEICFPEFLADLKAGKARRIYQTDKHAAMDLSPVPDYSLIDASKYAQLSIQFSRGCPHNCEFCEITALLGKKFRTKSSLQILEELDNIYATGFRGSVFFVDDNFIGNRKKLKEDLLPEILNWNKRHKNPFTFVTEASVDLSDDTVLMEMMAAAGFVKVFVGIESPDESSLMECDKKQNIRRDLARSVQTMQSHGLEVSAGFIVGFDNDTPGTFQRQTDFIQQTGIITAMVGLLNAPSRTRLYQRLDNEGRILGKNDGNNTNYSLNFIPKMDKDLLIKGYLSILNSIYAGKAYYARVMDFMKDFHPRFYAHSNLSFEQIHALIRSILILGILSRHRRHYWKLFLWSLFKRPELFPLAITYSIYGYHFRKAYRLDS